MFGRHVNGFSGLFSAELRFQVSRADQKPRLSSLSQPRWEVRAVAPLQNDFWKRGTFFLSWLCDLFRKQFSPLKVSITVLTYIWDMSTKPVQTRLHTWIITFLFWPVFTLILNRLVCMVFGLHSPQYRTYNHSTQKNKITGCRTQCSLMSKMQ